MKGKVIAFPRNDVDRDLRERHPGLMQSIDARAAADALFERLGCDGALEVAFMVVLEAPSRAAAALGLTRDEVPQAADHVGGTAGCCVVRLRVMLEALVDKPRRFRWMERELIARVPSLARAANIGRKPA